MSLSDQQCKPPQPGDRPLPAEEIEQLLPEIPDWSLDGKEIEREFQFKNFREAMAFVNKVADLAESQGHHPDIFISYKVVRLTLSTHKIGGLSQNDFILAARTDTLLRGEGGGG